MIRFLLILLWLPLVWSDDWYYEKFKDRSGRYSISLDFQVAPLFVDQLDGPHRYFVAQNLYLNIIPNTPWSGNNLPERDITLIIVNYPTYTRELQGYPKEIVYRVRKFIPTTTHYWVSFENAEYVSSPIELSPQVIPIYGEGSNGIIYYRQELALSIGDEWLVATSSDLDHNFKFNMYSTYQQQ